MLFFKKNFLFISLSVLFLQVCLPLPSNCTATQENLFLFNEANEFFHKANEEGDPQKSRDLYERALLRYEKLSQETANGKLYYNIGNTYFQLGDIGRAIVNYRRAEHFIPHDENLRQNLSHVLSKRRDIIPVQQEEKLLRTLFFWHYDLPLQMRLNLLCGFNLLFWLSAALFFFTSLPVPRWLATSLITITLLLATSLSVEYFDPPAPAGVIVAPEVVARQGDGHNYQPSFTAPLHAGTEFTLLENRKSWFHVELKDGRQCWLAAQSSELI